MARLCHQPFIHLTNYPTGPMCGIEQTGDSNELIVNAFFVGAVQLSPIPKGWLIVGSRCFEQ